MDEFMEMPALGTEISLADGVAFAGVCTYYPVVLYLEIDSAAAAAVIANGHDAVHGNTFSGS